MTVSFFFLFGLWGTSLLAAQCQAAANVFSKTFQNLHKDPGPQTISRSATIKTKWIEQKLDHFDEYELRTWQMRYMANDEFYKKGGPLFIYVGGEWDISPGPISRGHIYDLAKEHQAYLFYTEHRYYGESKPLSDLSTPNLQYLHVLQALADLAHFIRIMKITIPGMAESKVILSGASYSATMVTWFKRLYPDMAAGCFASSAPLLAKFDFEEYKEVCGRSIRLLGGDRCYERIHNGFKDLERLIMDKNTTNVKSLFNLCENFNETEQLDVWSLFSTLTDAFADVVQNHNNDTIQKTCREIMKGNNDVEGLTRFLNKYFDTNECKEMNYNDVIKSINYTDYESGMYRQWYYQTCNEYGWYQTSKSRYQPFGTQFPIEIYARLCYDLFGEKFTPEFIQQQIEITNVLFGGLQPDVENVYWTHGQLDPWSAMGIKYDETATVIPLRAHCMDFGSISNNDTPQLRASKERLAQLVREWLNCEIKITREDYYDLLY